LAELLDIFGFLAVLLRGVKLVLQTLILGGVIFIFVVVTPRLVSLSSGTERIRNSCRKMIACSALALAFTQLVYLFVHSAILMETANMRFDEVIGANFFVAGSASALAALLIDNHIECLYLDQPCGRADRTSMGPGVRHCDTPGRHGFLDWRHSVPGLESQSML
jgi:copper resistance protein D